jgi:16S rRNA processing protein RimM
MRSSDRKIILGKLGKPHSLNGSLYLHYYGDNPDSLLDFLEIYSGGKPLGKVQKINKLNDRITIHISGIDNRNKAEALRDEDIYVLEEQLPKLEVGNFYHYQLEGLSILNKESENLGIVDRVMITGANDVLVVKPSQDSIDKQERLIPYVKSLVIEDINMKSKIITVVWPGDF